MDETTADPGLPRSLPGIYDKFVHQDAGQFLRIHIHLHQARLASRGGRFWDRVADPYVTCQAVGPMEAATVFPIGKQTFPVVRDSHNPVWDAKGTVVCHNKAGGTTGLHFAILDSNQRRDDKVLGEFTLPLDQLPKACAETLEQPGAYTKFVRSSDADQDLQLEFSIKVTDGWLIGPEDIQALRQDTEELTYSEHVITSGDNDADLALLQCWKHKDATHGAVLWILGRNDCFMHPHVARPLFWNDSHKKYDLYVLNYSFNGVCRKQGWVRDAHLNSHNPYGNFDCYNGQIQKALDVIQDNDYQQLLGYAHSTGGPVLLNYLMECCKDDDPFDGFIFNSPFLDWGFVGGDLNEFILEHVGFLDKIGVLGLEQKLGVAVPPEELSPAVHYLGQDIVLCAWSAKLWSQYYFDFDMRPLYQVPMTGGFAKGVTAVHKKVQERHEQRQAITTKPFLCITSRGDDVLKAAETTSRADWIGPNRCEIELNDNSHDVFLSQDCSDTAMAVDMVKCWMKGKGFL